MKNFLNLTYIKTIKYQLTVMGLSLLIIMLMYYYYVIITVGAEVLGIPHTELICLDPTSQEETPVIQKRGLSDDTALFLVYGFLIIAGFATAWAQGML